MHTNDTSIEVAPQEAADGGQDGGDGSPILLCSSLAELVAISRSAVAVVGGASRLANLFEASASESAPPTATAPPRPSSSTVSPRVECQILIRPETYLDKVLVEWELKTPPLAWLGEGSRRGRGTGANESPGAAGAGASVALQGTSELILDENAKVRRHRILGVSLNGQPQDASAVGTFLSGVRAAARNLQDSPLGGFLTSAALGSAAADGPSFPFNVARSGGDDLFRQLASAAAAAVAAVVPIAGTGAGTEGSEAEPEREDAAFLAPVFVIEAKDGNSTGNGDNGAERDTSSSSQSRGTTPLDEYNARQDRRQHPPIPGSSAWPLYARAHQLVVHFDAETLPALASGGGSETSNAVILRWLAPGCRYSLATPVPPPPSPSDRASVLLETPAKVARLYGALAAWRRRFAGSDWAATQVELLDWDLSHDGGCRVRVLYRSTLRLPSPPSFLSASASSGGTVDVRVTGSDAYRLDAQGRILQVVVEGTQVNGGSPQEGQVFVRSLCAAIDAGGGGGAGVFGDDGWPAWLPRLASAGKAGGSEDSASNLAGLQPRRTGPSQALEGSKAEAFSDEAAAAAFRVMEALIREVPMAMSPARQPSPPMAPPASAYLAENVRVLGYLDETILVGRPAYETSWNVALTAFAAALRSGRVETESPEDSSDALRVELTASRSIRLTAILRLKVKPIPGAILPALSSSFPLPIGSDSFSIPAQITIVSEYVSDSSTGRITAHKLVETRVNGKLAPADVVARWVRDWSKQATVEAKPSGADASLWKALYESAVANWVLSRQNT
jgi:hypothetical protein